MNLAILEIPDDVHDLRNWLERELVGVRLRELVTELQAMQPERIDNGSLSSYCGADLPVVCEQGLSVLTDSQLRGLLRRPRLLMELQERVLVDGGNHWSNVPRTVGHEQAVRDGWRALEAAIELPVSTIQPTKSPASDASRQKAGSARWLSFAVALAASVLVAIFLWHEPRSSSGWGWDRPGALAADHSPPAAYLNHLADAAEEWSKKRPADATQLATRLRQFRHGCDTLIAAPHAQLSEQDRKWLVDKCRNWAAKIDQHLADLVDAHKPFNEVQRDANATVSQLVRALRKGPSS